MAKFDLGPSRKRSPAAKSAGEGLEGGSYENCPINGHALVEAIFKEYSTQVGDQDDLNAIFKTFETKITLGGIRSSAVAAYSVQENVIRLRSPRVESPLDYFTVLHELGHMSGHSTHLHRGTLTRYDEQKLFAREEEAIANLVATAICLRYGIALTMEQVMINLFPQLYKTPILKQAKAARILRQVSAAVEWIENYGFEEKRKQVALPHGNEK